MHGAIPPFPNTSSWRGAYTGTTLLLPLLIQLKTGRLASNGKKINCKDLEGGGRGIFERTISAFTWTD
jgi:hypothetical protein